MRHVQARAGRQTRRGASDPLHYTYSDLFSMPDDNRRYEILDGELVVSPSPLFRHQRVVKRLFLSVHQHVEVHDLGEAFFAPLDVVFEAINVLEPDVLFVAKARVRELEPEAHVHVVPDLVVEVISKGTAKRDRVTKREIYQRFRVPHYWIVDPFSGEVEENVLRGKRYVRRSRLRGDATFAPAIFPGLAIALGQLFR